MSLSPEFLAKFNSWADRTWGANTCASCQQASRGQWTDPELVEIAYVSPFVPEDQTASKLLIQRCKLCSHVRFLSSLIIETW